MKRFMFILLAFALLVSVGVAEAKKPPKPTPAQQVATKNAAWMCKALRAANPTAFRVAFGQNKNGKNAYGKCVSAHARAKHLNRVITIKNVTINATGTVTNAGAVGCQFTVAGCTLTSSGTLTGVSAVHTRRPSRSFGRRRRQTGKAVSALPLRAIRP
jgi:hypothetical protein